MGGGSPAEVVLFALPFPEVDGLLDKFRARFPNHEFIYKHVTSKNQGKIHDTEVLDEHDYDRVTVLCTLASLPTPDHAHSIKFIHFFSAGTDHIQTNPIYTDTDITLTTSSGIHGPMISEWVILQILSNSHKQRQLLDWQSQRRWGTHGELGQLRDSVGMRFGVLGYGSIGRQAARVSKAMGMDVIAYTASERKTDESKHDSGYIVPGTGDADGRIPSAWYHGLDKPSLHNFLKQDIDILLISVPLTKETRHFLGEEEFEILSKKKALIINISRGSIIVQDALIAAVKSGKLRGAALDVTDPEPLPKDSELWDIDGIAITPHISGLSVAYQQRSLEILRLNLERLEEGKDLLNVVDRRRGY